MGPTASGKTAAAFELHDRLPVRLISVDSAQVYRFMNIGTGKPDAATLAHYPHALIDIIDPEQAYSAADFAADAVAEIEAAWTAGLLPLLVGGTGLYFRALLQGLNALPRADAATRSDLEAEARAAGWPALHRRLAALDPATAARLHPNDSQRISRALEVCLVSGRRYSELIAAPSRPALSAECLKLVVSPAERRVLHERIAARFHQMLDAGLVDEVASLRTRPGVHAGLPSMRSVGYRQTWECLDGTLRREDLPERGIVATRQLARRQLTWLRSESEARWMDSSAPALVKMLNDAILLFVEAAA